MKIHAIGSRALKSETMKRRNQQNTMNIYATFWAWLAQFFTNILDLFLLHVFYGQQHQNRNCYQWREGFKPIR